MPKFKHALPQLALILITLLWGGTFLAVQYALNFSSPMFFVGCRFAVAAVVIWLISLKALRGLNRNETLAGTAIGALIAIGYGTQTIALQSILSSESAFLTALYVPLVPILMWLIFHKRPSLMVWLGTTLAFTGLLLLTGNSFSTIQFNDGQTLTLFCALAVALEIILIGYFPEKSI